MFIKDKESFKKGLDSVKLSDPNKIQKYGVSLVYIFRTLVLIFVIIAIVAYSSDAFLHPFDNNNLLSIILILILIIYVLFNLYTVLGYSIKVGDGHIKNQTTDIKINDIIKIQYILARVNGKSYERVLSIITKDHKEYMFRLNIRKPLVFIKQVSILTGIDVEFID